MPAHTNYQECTEIDKTEQKLNKNLPKQKITKFHIFLFCYSLNLVGSTLSKFDNNLQKVTEANKNSQLHRNTKTDGILQNKNVENS